MTPIIPPVHKSPILRPHRFILVIPHGTPTLLLETTALHVTLNLRFFVNEVVEQHRLGS